MRVRLRKIVKAASKIISFIPTLCFLFKMLGTKGGKLNAS
jgi:hypothetical protein